MIDHRDLSNYGIQDIKEIIYNPSFNTLFAEETKPGLDGYEKGIITRSWRCRNRYRDFHTDVLQKTNM